MLVGMAAALRTALRLMGSLPLRRDTGLFLGRQGGERAGVLLHSALDLVPRRQSIVEEFLRHHDVSGLPRHGEALTSLAEQC